jgi:hypothetical protein
MPVQAGSVLRDTAIYVNVVHNDLFSDLHAHFSPALSVFVQKKLVET